MLTLSLSESSARSIRRAGTQERAAALVVVLSCLVLASIVVVAFLASSATESNASKSYAEGGRARLLAQSAMEIVQGQIWAATTQKDPSGRDAGWASQPGAIRTFFPGNEAFQNVFKLYSSDTMVADETFNAGTAAAPTEVPTDWDLRPNQFVDLNLPVSTDGGNTLSFPIIDPRAKTTSAATSVAGFDYGAAVNKVVLPSVAPDTARLPMPVRWLYQLKDGTLSAMDDAGKIAGADLTNPVMGRVAFWTDDDTCKININTAGEGVFWDIPRGDSSRVVSGVVGNANAIYAAETERSFAQFQPAQREYQRYPGHPGTVSLKAVFPSLLAEEIYAITPRFNSDNAGSNLSDLDFTAWRRPTGAIPLKQERLYASLDELLFRPTRGFNNPTSAINPANISILQAFVTAYNRSAEMNLFGKPRISMWPINAAASSRTPVDKWFALCSTIGGQDFFVKRSDQKSSTADANLNQRIFDYMSDLTSKPVPGFAGSIDSKIGAANADQIIAMALDYVRCTNLLDTSDTSPSSSVKPFSVSNPTVTANTIFNSGTPGTFLGFYGAGQVVPMIFGAGRGLGRFDTVSEVGILFHSMMWNTRAGPIPPGESAENPVRLGEFTGVDVPNTQSAPPSGDFNANKGNPPMYRAIFLVEPANVAQGFPQANMDYTYTIENLDKIQVNGTSIQFPATAIETMQGGTVGVGGAGGYTSSVAASLTWVTDSWNNASNPKDGLSSSVTPPPMYRFISAPFPIPGPVDANGIMASNPTFLFSCPAPIVLTIRSPSGDEIQKMNFRFEPTALPTPLPGKPMTTGLALNRTNLGRRNQIHWAGQPTFIQEESTVISLEPSGLGTDLRWLAAQPEVGENVFKPHSKYHLLVQTGTPPQNKANSFRRDMRSEVGFSQATFGKLIAGVTTGAPADIPDSVNGVLNANGLPGDWDTGLGDSRDGSYINRPDEGNTRYHTTPGDSSRLPYFTFGGFADKITPGYATYFAPNRQVPSPGMLGSLPSRLSTSEVWETLLFNPNPAAGDEHRGFGEPLGEDPPDYVWLDFFTMPTIEPYAISEPFSSAGKINLNYQMLPFTYIERTTALRALFSGSRVAAIPDTVAATFKSPNSGTKAGANVIFRHKINADETIKQFRSRFNSGEVFRTAGEICAVDLYPLVTAQNVTSGTPDQPIYDASRNSIKTWWSTRRLTGDNLREQPYTTLYQNLTTQSNTYTIHVWSQAIRKAPGTPPDEMTSRDSVTGEHRVAYSIERFIDPNNPNLPDFAQSTTPSANGFYQFRVNNTKQFMP